MTRARMEYPGHVFPKTRSMARWLITIELVVMAPAIAWQIVLVRPGRPLQDFLPVAFLGLACFVFAFRSLRHLERLEQLHESPTDVMSYLLHLAAALPLVFWVTIAMVLNAYSH